MIRAGVALAGVLLVNPLCAADLLSVSVERDGRRYVIESTSRYDASSAALAHVLLDYDNFTQVSSVFKEARYLEPTDDGVRRGYTRVEGCVLFFCQSIERIDQINVADGPLITAVAEPEPDDFRYSHGSWRFEPEDDAVVIHYRLEMEPGFWIPPLIGPYILKRRLIDGAVDAMQRVEARAQAFDAGTY
ncbi:MAG: SRPBCC family protein [Pseudomonadota bacterium]